MSAEVKEAAAELLEDREEGEQKEENADEETSSDSDADNVPSSCATAIEQTAGQKPVEFEIVYVHISKDAKEVDLTRHRMKTIHGLETFTQVEKLCLRWNLLKKIENLDCTANTLTELDLYDNQVEKIENLSALTNLVTLDLSYNRIAVIEGLDQLVNLKTLYFVHNKITRIEGLDKLVNLEYLELGDNRIKKIENLDNNFNLKRLFLGANQIRNIENVSHLHGLEVLSLPANAIIHIQGLEGLHNLREIYFSQNGIQHVKGFPHNPKLEILDLNQNRVESVKDIRHLQNLTDFWAKGNKASRSSTISFCKGRNAHLKLADWSVFDELEHLPRLSFVYLNDNPFSTNNETYRAKAIRLLPQVRRLDAQFVRDESVGVRPWKTDAQDEQ